MTIKICVGSSCHLKGSYKIIELMKENLEKHNLTEKVELGAAFCLGKCTSGVSIEVDGEIITGLSPENFDEIFSKYILSTNIE